MPRQANILGQRVRHFRKQAGLTQADLGSKVFPDQKSPGGYISYIERDKVYPTTKRLQALADVFKIRVDDLRMELRQLDPKAIKWRVCFDKIPTLQDRIIRAEECKNPPESACYLDEEHDYLDKYATEELQMFGAVALGLRNHTNSADKAGMDVGHIKLGVYHPGKDLDIRETV